MLVTGDIGCGKTTLCRRLLAQLPPRTFISVILNPFLTAEDLLKQVLVDFGLVSNNDGSNRARSSFSTKRRT